jgi:hypothetical protein
MNAKKFVNLTKFLLAGALVLGMTACSSDDNIPKGGTETDVKTYMTVSITGNSLQRTTTPNNGTSQEGAGAENTVSSLTVFLVNPVSTTDLSQNKIIKIQPLSGTDLMTTSESGTTIETQGKESKAFKVPAGTYKVYVIANPTSKFTSLITENTSSEQDLLNVINSSALIHDDYANANGFLMTNAINYNGDAEQIPTVAVASTNGETNPAKPTSPIHVDRMAVKITANNSSKNFNQLYYDGSNGSSIQLIHYNGTAPSPVTININLTGYSLINTYNKANLYQKWSGTSSTFEQELMTPNYKDNGYSASDFSNQKSNFSTRTSNTANTIANFGALSINPNTTYTSLDNASYTLENNPYNTYSPTTGVFTKYDKFVTGVLFQAQAVNPNSSNSPVTFYSYNRKYYSTLADIQKEYPDVFAKYFDGTSVVPSSKTAAGDQLNEALQVLNHANNTGANDLRVRYGIKVYENGNMYYTYYIKDPNYKETQGTGTNTYYAIMRNSIYDLRVTKLKRIGEDIPFGWQADGDTPIDDTNVYMTVELLINQWTLNTFNDIILN